MRKIVLAVSLWLLAVGLNAQTKTVKLDTTAATYIDLSGEIKNGWVIRASVDTLRLVPIDKENYKKVKSHEVYYYILSTFEFKDKDGKPTKDSLGRSFYNQWVQISGVNILQDYKVYLRDGGKRIQADFLNGLTGTSGELKKQK